VSVNRLQKLQAISRAMKIQERWIRISIPATEPMVRRLPTRAPPLGLLPTYGEEMGARGRAVPVRPSPGPQPGRGWRPGETTASEALLGEALTRLKLLGRRLGDHLDAGSS
jgi:hypothetical protein